MQPPIASILHQETIRRLSGDGAFERGKTYYAEGRVLEVHRKDASIVAKVRGTGDPYEVRMWMKDESLAYSCTCPQGQEQAFCKHAVAVALSFVAGREPSPSPDLRAKALPFLPSSPSSASPSSSPAPLSSSSSAPSPPLPLASRPEPSLADALRALSHEDLVVLVLEAAFDDPTFRDRLSRRLRS